MQSANESYRNSGSQLSFKEWLEERKATTNEFLLNKNLNEIIESAKNEIKQTTKMNVNLESKKILGLDRNLILVSIAIIATAIIVKQIVKK